MVSPGSDNTSDADLVTKICVCRGCDAVVNSCDLSQSPAADSPSVVDTVEQHSQRFFWKTRLQSQRGLARPAKEYFSLIRQCVFIWT